MRAPDDGATSVLPRAVPAGTGHRRSPLPAVLLAAILLGSGVVLFLAASSLGQREPPRLAGGIRPVNAGALDALDIRAHNSPGVVRNPTNGANLVIVNRVDTPQFSCGLHVSFDAGATWSSGQLPQPQGEEPKCYAPDAAFDQAGTLYVFFVTLQGPGNVPNAGWLTTSADGGRSFSTPAPALGRNAFQVRLLADPAERGRLYLSWLQAGETGTLQFPSAGNPINVARSDDGGTTWKPPVQVSASERQRAVAPSLAAGPRGQLYVLYLDLVDDALDYHGGHEGRGGPPYDGRWQLVLARSLDGGRRWTESVVEPRLVPTQRFVVFTPPFPSLAVDQDSGAVYAGFTDGRDGDADVRVWASGDDGSTWSTGRRVNDTRRRDGTSQHLPTLAVAPDGRLDVVYLDRRADSDDVLTEVSLQSSSNGGSSFGARLRLSDTAFDSRIGSGSERELPDLGSRLGLVSTDAGALAVWPDTRSGTQASNKTDLARAVVAFPAAPALSGLRVPFRVAGVALGVTAVLLLAFLVRRQRADP